MPEYNLCRICLTEDMDPSRMHPLFDADDPVGHELVRKIEECGGIQLRPLDDIPSMLCFRCLEALNGAYKFRELCQACENAFIENFVKTEVKTEYLESSSLDGGGIGVSVGDVDGDVVDESLIFDMNTEYIDGEEIEMTVLTEASVGDVLEENDGVHEHEPLDEEQAQFVDEDDVEESDYMYLPNSSDTDYDPEEKEKNKTKTKKVKTNKRGRPRLSHTGQQNNIDKQRNRRSEEETPTSIMCEICGNIYTKRGALNMHMRRHLDEKPFACEICSKSFAGPSELNRHIRVHTGEKPFACKFCKRSFADRSSNIRHERTHTNERPFSCLTCGKAFAYSNVLKNHMLTHTGEKPFLCVPCNKTFSRKHQLDQHIGTIIHQATVKTRTIWENSETQIDCINE